MDASRWDFTLVGDTLLLSKEATADWMDRASHWLDAAQGLLQGTLVLGLRGRLAAALVEQGNVDPSLISRHHAQSLLDYLNTVVATPYVVLLGDAKETRNKPVLDGLGNTLSALCPGGVPYHRSNPWMPWLVKDLEWSPAAMFVYLEGCGMEQFVYSRSKLNQGPNPNYYVEAFLAKALFPMLRDKTWMPAPDNAYKRLWGFLETKEALATRGVEWADRDSLQALIYHCTPPDLVHCLTFLRARGVTLDVKALDAYFPLPVEACPDDEAPEAMNLLIKFLAAEVMFKTKTKDPFTGVRSKMPDEPLAAPVLLRKYHPELMALIDMHVSLTGSYLDCAPLLVDSFRALRDAGKEASSEQRKQDEMVIANIPDLFEGM